MRRERGDREERAEKEDILEIGERREGASRATTTNILVLRSLL